jgi:hypothetical protein
VNIGRAAGPRRRVEVANESLLPSSGDTTPISDFTSAGSSNSGTTNPVGFGPVLAFGDFAKNQSVLCFFRIAEANPVAAATLQKSSRRCGPNFTEKRLHEPLPLLPLQSSDR